MDLIPSQGGVAVCLDPHSGHGVVKDFIVLDETQALNTFKVHINKRRGVDKWEKTITEALREMRFLLSPEL